MKSLFKNSVYNIIYKLFLLAFPLVSSIYVSRILLPVGVGKVAYAQNLVSYFITFAGLGVSTYGIREIGKCQNDKEARTEVFFELFSIVFRLTVFCSFFYYAFVLFFQPEDKVLYLTAGVQLILSGFSVDWFYQGMEEYAYITKRSIAIKIISLGFIILAVRNHDDIIPYALMSCVAGAGNNILNFYQIRKHVGRPIFSDLKLKRHLKPLLILLSTNLSVELYTKLDTTTLGILANDVNVGYYNYATKISTIVVNLAASLSTILLPRLSYYHKKSDYTKLNEIVATAHKGILTIAFPATFGLFLMADDIVMVLFGEAFFPAALTIKILSFLVLVKSIGNLYGTQVLLTFGKEKILLLTTILGAVSNVTMNIILIPRYQENGAAVASVISEILVCIVQIYLAYKYVNPKVKARDYFSIIAPCIAMALVVFNLRIYINNIFIETIVCIISGGGVYYLLCLMVKNESVLFVKRKICGILKI
jgi:O-antigen/teichoic acid export membrane protein